MNLEKKTYCMMDDLALKLQRESEICPIIYDAITLTCRMEKENKIIGKSACITALQNIGQISEKGLSGEWRRIK